MTVKDNVVKMNGAVAVAAPAPDMTLSLMERYAWQGAIKEVNALQEREELQQRENNLRRTLANEGAAAIFRAIEEARGLPPGSIGTTHGIDETCTVIPLPAPPAPPEGAVTDPPHDAAPPPPL